MGGAGAAASQRPRHGGDVFFDRLSFTLRRNDRYGLIGIVLTWRSLRRCVKPSRLTWRFVRSWNLSVIALLAPCPEVTGYRGASAARRGRTESVPPGYLVREARIFSVYLARRSNSRLRGSPSFRSRRAVTSLVWGMIQTENSSLVTSATVRLMPSTAMQPLGTRVAAVGGVDGDAEFVVGAFLLPDADGAGGVDVAGDEVAAVAAVGGERTLEVDDGAGGPAWRRLVRARVSSRRSKASCGPSIWVTVRQQPLRAMLSPSLASAAMGPGVEGEADAAGFLGCEG